MNRAWHSNRDHATTIILPHNWLISLIMLTSFLLAGCSASGAGSTSIQVEGAVQRDLSNSEIFYEEISTGQQLYIQKKSGEDIMVLMILMPRDLASTSYAISSTGPVRAEYFEAVNGISRQFRQGTSGILTITGSGSALSGSMDFTTNGLYQAEGETIRVTGTFTNVPYVPYAEADRGNSSSNADNLAGMGLICAMAFLVIASFGFQFYVGRVVYESDGSWVLRSLRGTRTFIRGWAMPDLRLAMIGWSIVVAGFLFFVLIVVVLSGAL